MNNFRSNSVRSNNYDTNKNRYRSASKCDFSTMIAKSEYGIPNEFNSMQNKHTLENERKKFKQIKEKFEYDLNNERKLRIQYETKLIKIKDQFSKKQVNNTQLDFKINNILHQNKELIAQNNRLKAQICRLQQLYGAKINDLETKIIIQGKQYKEMISKYKIEFENFKTQGQQYIEQIRFDFERKIKNLQEKVRIYESNKKDLQYQNSKINNILAHNNLAFEQQIRDLKNKAKQEQLKKTQILNKNFDQKIKMVDEMKESLIRKNNELIRLIQDKDKQFEEKQTNLKAQYIKTMHQNQDLTKQIRHLNYIINKLKTQLSQKDFYIENNYSNFNCQIQSLKHQIKRKKEQNSNLFSDLGQFKIERKYNQRYWEQKRKIGTDKSNYEDFRYKNETERVLQDLKYGNSQIINSAASYRK